MGGPGWDAYEETPPRRGTPPWGKALVGCGAAAFLLMGGCAVLAYWGTTQPGQEAAWRFLAGRLERVMEKPWGMLTGVVDAIRTDEGALALYRDNPLLKADYPTEADFMGNAAVWREKLASFPIAPPSLDELDRSDFHLSSSRKPGRGAKTLDLAYTLPDGPRVRLAWEDGKLAELDIK